MFTNIRHYTINQETISTDANEYDLTLQDVVEKLRDIHEELNPYVNPFISSLALPNCTKQAPFYLVFGAHKMLAMFISSTEATYMFEHYVRNRADYETFYFIKVINDSWSLIDAVLLPFYHDKYHPIENYAVHPIEHFVAEEEAEVLWELYGSQLEPERDEIVFFTELLTCEEQQINFAKTFSDDEEIDYDDNPITDKLIRDMLFGTTLENK